MARCCERSARGAAAFVFLSSERYGWRALPRRVPAAELEAMLDHLPDSADPRAAAVIRSWYWVDANALPEPEAVLRGEGEVRGHHVRGWGARGMPVGPQ